MRVLQFWHQVEFFIPFDMQRQVFDDDDASWSVRSWTYQELLEAKDVWQLVLPADRRLLGFDVYLGIFDKALLASMTQGVLDQAAPVQGEDFEQEERGPLEGPTCMARIKAGATGEPLLTEMSVSTAPWALGRLQRYEGEVAAALDFTIFEHSVEVLKNRLAQFRAERTHAYCASAQDAPGADHAPDRPLSGAELLDLVALLQSWSGFELSYQNSEERVLVIRARTQDIGRKSGGTKANGLGHGDTAAEPSPDDADESDVAGESVEIDILNSFFAKDIARAIRSVEQGASSPALEAYLTPLADAQRQDLYQAAGRQLLKDTLAPAEQPRGHWVGPPQHGMSLMQQFAINSSFKCLGRNGLFSVNGPPGTGKTTLLRDVFAELITQRARVLSNLSSVDKAFAGEEKAEFEGKDPCQIRRLRPELLGFEMVVASSNNAAVENLSRDLPKAKALGEAGKTPWRDEQGRPLVGYLQAVARNVAARQSNGDYASLDADDLPWGLMAARLGRQANRRSFAAGLFIDASKHKKTPKRFDPSMHQSLWSWRDTYQGPEFKEAADRFKQADQAVISRINQLAHLARLHAQLRDRTREDFLAEAVACTAQCGQQQEIAALALQLLDEELSLCANQLGSLREEARLAEQDRPAWWHRWLFRDRYRRYQTDAAANRQAQREWLARQRETDSAHSQAVKTQAQAHAAWKQACLEEENKLAQWQAMQQEWAELSGLFPQAGCPAQEDELEQASWQIGGLWRDEALDKLRSNLFAAALTLHEAWLAQALKKKKCFGGHMMAISHLLSGKRLLKPEQALTIWQGLFMVVPVVSSTFASIASQFRDLGAGSLGWLFIDEAGQAVPQAAVGALWRSQRVMVVGDPLQIEPVFTVPMRLIELLKQGAGLPENWRVAPHQSSVQTVADAANPVGAWREGEDQAQWLGSPLRVHRRCVEPMFEIANRIAYQDKMVFFDPLNPASRRPPADSLDLGCSAWVNLGGTVQGKQVVHEQVQLVVQAVVAVYQRTGSLPPLYIISPFRRIREALFKAMVNVESWPRVERPPVKTLRAWCKERIGTVHTFQGKEESMVWMVLGCDDQTQGAAQWAAGKPNLLNVAITRAKHRFFIIGAEDLWAGLDYFSDATPLLLPRISGAEFLLRARQAGLEQTSS